MLNHRLTKGLLVAGLAVWLVLQWSMASRLTPTHDEYWHLPIGVNIWTNGRFDQDRINPPLVRMFAALPLVIGGSRSDVPQASRESDYGDAFVFNTETDARVRYRSGRMMIALSGLLGGLLLTWFAFRLGGAAAGWPVLLLWFTDPNLFAHGGLVTHDFPAAASFVVMMIVGYFYWEAPSRKWAIQLGLFLGLAQLIKFTSLILIPITIVTLLVGRFRSTEGRGRELWIQLGLILGICLLVINAGYGFQGTFSSWSSYQFESDRFHRLTGLFSFLQGIPLPFPRDYLYGLDRLFFVMQEPHPSYLNEVWSSNGFRSYYVMCWLYKTPHHLQLLTLVGFGLVLRKARTEQALRRLLWLILPVMILLTLLASFSGNQLGYRYVLPIYPMGILLAGLGCGFLSQKLAPQARPVALLTLLVLGGAALRYHPHHLTYFNELAGGPAEGKYLLLDSNLDWGQALHDLRDELEANQQTLDGLVYFGSFPPRAIQLNMPPAPQLTPAAGRYAISVNFLEGRPHVIRLPDNSWQEVDLDYYGYFRYFRPVKYIGNSIAIFEISESDRRTYEQALKGTF